MSEDMLRERCKEIACDVGAEAGDAVSVILQFAKAERAAGLMDALTFVCEDCANGLPVEEDWDSGDGFWHFNDRDGHWRCAAEKIRKLARAG